MAVLGLLPFVVGIVIGVPLVAAEIETGTAVLVWSLDASRRRWLLTRVVIFGTVLTVLLMIPAAAGNLLERFRVPRWEPDTTIYLDFGSRGWLFVERGLVTFAIAVTAGLLIGRVLQGLVVAGLAASVLLVVLNAAHGVGLPAPAPTQVQPDRYVLPVVGAEPRYVDANGRVYSPEQIRAAAPAAVGTPEFFAWFDREGFLQVQFGIPGERLWIVEAREFAVGSAGAIMVLAGATWLAGRRRPY
ncbi:MAG TPA: hypothetical protein VFI12_09350 [Thermomicrobiales bacterium]|nr:hypothetical protein [Thermomicrobiales bacterium]